MTTLIEDQSQAAPSADELFMDGMRYRYGDDGTPRDDQKAREYFADAAEMDHAEAQLELAFFLFELGERDEAQGWLDALVFEKYGPAIHYHVVSCDGLHELDEDEQDELIQQACEWYESRALAGEAKRQFEFSELLFCCHDRKEGLRWLKASAAQDYSPACYRLGHEYLRAEVSDHSTQQGVYWLSRATELGCLSAYEDLGDLYLLGHGRAPNQWTAPAPRIEPDKAAAVAWYERAIAKGMRRAAYKLGCYYLKGEHLDQDLALAEKWLLHAAQEGSASARQTLGEEYAYGVRFQQDANAAIHWLKLAAESYKSVGFKLVEIYLDGKITPVDFNEAIRWLRHATESGAFIEEAQKVVSKFGDGRFNTAEAAAAELCLAQMAIRAWAAAADADHQQFAHSAFRLAKHYDLGVGVEKNMDVAICWYRKSAQQGLHGAKKRLKELDVEWEVK